MMLASVFVVHLLLQVLPVQRAGMVKGLGGTALPPRTGRTTSLPSSIAGVGVVAEALAALPRVHSSNGVAALDAGSADQLARCVGGVDAVVTPSGEPPQPALSDHSAAAQQHHSTQQQQPQQQQPQQQQPQQQQQAVVQLEGSAAGRRKRKRQQAPPQPSHGERPHPRSRPGSEEARPLRSRRDRSATPAAGAAGATPSKRRRGAAAAAGGSGASPGGRHRHSKYADIMHRYVEVPGAIF